MVDLSNIFEPDDNKDDDTLATAVIVTLGGFTIGYLIGHFLFLAWFIA